MSVVLTEKDRVHLWVSPRLRDILAGLQKEIAIQIKRQWKLKEVTVNGTIASDALAAQYLEEKEIRFKIRKTSMNTGVLEFL